jgi:hypothetical protein
MSDTKTLNDHMQTLGLLREELDKALAAEFAIGKDAKAADPRADAIQKIARARVLLADLGPALREAFASSRK